MLSISLCLLHDLVQFALMSLQFYFWVFIVFFVAFRRRLCIKHSISALTFHQRTLRLGEDQFGQSFKGTAMLNQFGDVEVVF